LLYAKNISVFAVLDEVFPSSVFVSRFNQLDAHPAIVVDVSDVVLIHDDNFLCNLRIMHLNRFIEHISRHIERVAPLIRAVLVEPISDVLSADLRIKAVDVLVLLIVAVPIVMGHLLVLPPLAVDNHETEAEVGELPALAAVRVALDFADGESFHCFLLIIHYIYIITKQHYYGH